MVLTRRLKTKFVIWAITLAVGMVIGAAYSYLVYPPGSPDPCDWRVGACIALLIGLFTMPLEIFSRELRLMVAIRSLPYGLHWLVRSLIHLGGIMAAMLGSHWAFDTLIMNKPPFQGLTIGNLLQDAVFCAISLMLVIFVLEMYALLGGKVLANSFLGNYHAPSRKQRIFLLVDMVKSSTAAATLGDRRFHGYLSETFRLVEAAVEEAGGEIYTFIGDALIASWPLQDPARNAGPLEAATRALAALEAAGPEFAARYGMAPQVRMVMHGGPVMLGQYGDTRRQVTYMGEVLIALARMESFAKGTPYELLVSLRLLRRLPPLRGLATAPLAAALRRGWTGSEEILAVQRLAAAAAAPASQMPSFAPILPVTDPHLKAAK